MGKAVSLGSLRATMSRGERAEGGHASSLGRQTQHNAAFWEPPLRTISPVLPPADAAPLVVQVHPAQSIVPQGGSHSLRCQVSGSPPHYFYWSREDGRPMPSSSQQRHQGTRGPGALSSVSHPSGRGSTGLFTGILSLHPGPGGRRGVFALTSSHPLPTRL